MRFDKVIQHIREINEKNRIEMMSLPQSVNAADFAGCIDLILKFFNSIMRSHLVIQMCELAEGMELSGRDKAQLTFLKETIRENILALYRGVSRVIDGLLRNYPTDSFEYAAFKELREYIEKFLSKYLPQETKETQTS